MPARAGDRADIRIEAAENGGVVLRVTGFGRPPAQSRNTAQAAAAAHNAAEIDAFSRVAYLLGRVGRRQEGDAVVSTFRERFTGIHVEKSELAADGTARAEVTIPVPAQQVPELLRRIDDYIVDHEGQPGQGRPDKKD